MNPNQIVFILVAHFIGEFICQDGSMVSQKSKSLPWLVLHSMLYVIVIFFISSLGILFFNNWIAQRIAGLALLNGIAHFLIGYVMSKVNAYHKEQKKNHLYWIGLGFEQLLYSTILIYSLNYFNEY